jgi:hypothetical protein
LAKVGLVLNDRALAFQNARRFISFRRRRGGGLPDNDEGQSSARRLRPVNRVRSLMGEKADAFVRVLAG